MNIPLRFHPFLRPMVWGGRGLGEGLTKRLPTEEPYGESWEISDHALHRSVVAEGPQPGKTLRTLMEEDAQQLLGSAADTHSIFPWLIKFLDARDWLSVQVHPNEEEVQRLWPGEGSKTEAWFILRASPESRVYAGLLPGVEEKDFRRGLEMGQVEHLLHQFHPTPGDCVFLPAGTVHAVGGGVLLAEIQQTSDATFRLFDWNRKDAQGRSRPLHLEEGLACINWHQGPVHPVGASGYLPNGEGSPQPGCQHLVRCPYFTLAYQHHDSPFTVGGQDQLQVLLVLKGQAHLDPPPGPCSLQPGQTYLLPAAMPSLPIHPTPSLTLLLATLPDPVSSAPS
jgi:mannose-6-phosphate isomerase